MDVLSQILQTIDSYLGSSLWFPYVLLGTGLFFTLFLKFPQFRFFRHAVDVTKGKYEKSHHVGDTSHFQALNTALSGTVGTGNIGGVAYAIFLGGPAALFWMWATAFLGMCTKFVEVLLSHKYREKTADGTIAGGPMYYMKHRLNIKLANGREWPTGKILGAFFATAAVICSFGTGNMPQINNIASAMNDAFGVAHWITGAVLTIILALIILGGIKRIAKVAERVVPIMAFMYLLGALGVLITNYQNIIPSFLSIFENVFSGTAAAGGFLGATFSYAFGRGVARGLFSNEAGQGSAPIAHASARAEEPVSESMVAMLEPFIDTLIICTITGVVILASGAWIDDQVQNTFQLDDLVVLQAKYAKENPDQKQAVSDFMTKRPNTVQLFTGEIQVKDGVMTDGRFKLPQEMKDNIVVKPAVDMPSEYTLLHNRSFATEVKVYGKKGTQEQSATDGSKTPSDTKSLYTGTLFFEKGKLVGALIAVKDEKTGLSAPQQVKIGSAGVSLEGKSLVHSAALSTQAFKRSIFGSYGQQIVAICLLLFAFTTSISWSYYGDRSITYLFGTKAVFWYRLVYVTAFFYASLVDTAIVWKFADVAIVIMALPNLLGLWLLHREIKSSVKEYVENFNKENPTESQLKA